MKAYRPSDYRPEDDPDEGLVEQERAKVRRINIKFYAERAKAKLPLFVDRPRRAAC